MSNEPYLETKQFGGNDVRYWLIPCSISKDAETHGHDGQPAWQPHVQ